MVTAIAEDMIRLSEDMIAANDARLTVVDALVTGTRATLKRFRADRSKMAAHQAKDLAGFMGELSKDVEEIRRKAQGLIKEFDTASRQMSGEQSKRLAGFVRGLARDVTSMLSRFGKERGHVSREFGKRLDQEITDIKAAVEEILKDTGSFMNEQRAGMAKARQAWRNMSVAIGKARKVGFTTPAVEGKRDTRAAKRAIHRSCGTKDTATKGG
jgi:hypothetical protein